MKILQVINFFKPSWESGGPARVTFEISRQLVERKHQITVYTTDGFKSRLKVEKNRPIYVDGIKTYYFRNFSNYLTKKIVLTIPYYLPIVARKEIKNFDVIHIHEHRTFLAIIIHYYCIKYNIPYIIQAHGSVLPFYQNQKMKHIFDLFFGNRILKDASKVIALNKTEAEQYKLMGIDKNNIRIIPNGIEISDYDNLPEKGIFRNKFNIKDDERIILYLGRLHKIKGIELLITTFSDLIKELSRIVLIISGPDDGFLLTLKRQTEILNINNKVIFTGPLYERNKLEAYVDADVYVLPSKYEIFGITVLEANACGTPSIVTKQCGISDFVDENTGYIIDFDKEQLCKAIIKILNNDDLRLKFSKQAKEFVRSRFDWKKIILNIEDLYENI